MDHTFTKLQNIISQQLGLSFEKIHLDSDLGQELGADSLDMVELVLRIENEFEIEIEDPKASQIRTVQDALCCIEECCSNVK